MLPYREYQLWRLFYLVEPWGFNDMEYRLSALLAKLHNTNVAKKTQAKPISFFIRDMPKEVLKAIRREIKKEEASSKYDLETEEGRRSASEEIIKSFQQIFGRRLERKDK